MSSRFVLPFADVGSGIKPSDGAQLFFFDTGTSTPRNTFSDQAATTPNSNPVIADSKGVFSDIFIEGSYKVVLKDKDDLQIWEADPVEGFITASSASTVFDTVTLAIAANLSVGDAATTFGYTTSNDGGGADYVVVAGGTGADDGGSFIDMDNGLQLKLIIDTDINVKQFGAIADAVADDTSAFNALNLVATVLGVAINVPAGSYLVQTLSLTTSITGDGIGRTSLIFDCSVSAVDGVSFLWDADSQKEYWCQEMTISCRGGDGGKGITNEKGKYFTQANKIVIKDVQLQDEAGPNPAVTGFLTTFAWLGGVNVGDVQGLRIDNLFVYANYKVNEVDANSPVSTGLTLEGTQTGLFIECTGLWINACRTGLVIGDKTFGFFDNADITFSLDGVTGVTASNFNEIMFSNIAVNAQRTGYDFNGIVRLYLSSTFCNRHSSGIEQGNTWTGYKYETVTKAFISNAHSQPNISVASPQIGYSFLSCGDIHVTNLTAAGVDTNTVIDNCSGVHGSIIHADVTGTILDLKNNARALEISLIAGESFAGSWSIDDGSSDIRNVNIKVTSSTVNSTSGPTRFVESITLSDKDNIGGVDEGIVLLSQSGNLRVQALNSGAGTNVMLLDAASGVGQSVDFRVAEIIHSNGPRWLTGSGSPEGVRTAPVGSFYSQNNGGAGTTFFVKESGVGNTGWIGK